MSNVRVLGDQTKGRDMDSYSNPRTQPKCRIPQRMSPLGRQKIPVRRPNNSEQIVCTVMKIKHDCINVQRTSRSPVKQNRPRSSESRPKSSGRSREESLSGSVKHPPRNARLERSPIIPKKTVRRDNVNNMTVPVPQRHVLQKLQKLNQETSNKIEVFEEFPTDNSHVVAKVEDNPAMNVKVNWQENLQQFERMKAELDKRQKDIMELYATLRNTHKMITSLGQQANMPSAEDLQIMNVAKLTPDQLLQLCAEPRPAESAQFTKGSIAIDMNKLYETPTKLVATCEQTLIKRKEVIDWFESLKTEEKGVSKNRLMKKINEFNAENEMLNSSLQACKMEFLKELNEIVDYLRRGVNKTIALQLRTEELTYELSELNSQNADLRKQIHTAELYKSQTSRHRVEELEKDLKDEKCKKLVLKDRLTRAEGQMKISNERAGQLEAALEIARAQNWTLERTIQQLHEQNQKLQMEFDKELNNLTESIKNNTTHLEEIATAREKLQAEKEDLEKKLRELSDSYNESLGNMKEELNANVAKMKNAEKNFDEEKDERKKLETKLESLCAQLMESELRYKDLVKQLQEKDLQIAKYINIKVDLDASNQELEAANAEIEDYRNRLLKQNEAIKEIERNFKDTISLEKNLRDDLKNKDEYISELEKKQELLERQLQENEEKMSSYEDQLSSLKNHIEQLQEQFGEFENINQLHEMVNQQRVKLLETTRQNGEFAEALQKKDTELETHLEQLAEQESLLEQRDGVIKMLTNKEEEQANIIKLLRTNLEIRIKAETDLTQQTAKNNAEIESLATNLDTRKQQISQLEKIILTLEEQLRKIHVQRRKDQEKIIMLEKTVADYESYSADAKHTVDTPVDNLDNLIRILEKELGTTFEQQQDFKSPLKKRHDRMRQHDTYEYLQPEAKGSTLYLSDQDKPTKIGMGNVTKKPCQIVNDNLDRKKAITSIDTQKWLPNPDQL